MSKRKVVVEGGGKNLYEIAQSGEKFTARRVNVGLLGDSHNTIGTASSLDDALALIRSHSGHEIKEIEPPR